MKLIVIFILIQILQLSSAFALNDCPTIDDDLPLHAQRTNGAGGVIVMVTPTRPGVQYRQYEFDSKGIIFIHNHGFSSLDGTHAYYLLPRKQLPTMKALPNGKMEITTSAGDKIDLDASKNTRPPILLENTAESFHIRNRASGSGVQFTQDSRSRTIVIDAGPTNQGAPTQLNAKISDSHGNHCEIPNHDLFDITWIVSRSGRKDPKTVDLKYRRDPARKDIDLYAFIHSRCPTLALPTN